jgi:DNA-binding response OmpR family regulator
LFKSVMSHPSDGFAVLAVSDAKLRIAISYLFSVVLKKPVYIAPDPENAAASLENDPRNILLLIGLQGAESTSLELIRAACRLDPKPTIIVFDLNGTPDFGTKAFRAGADDVIRRPYGLQELAFRLRVRLRPLLDKCNRIDEDSNWDAEAFFADKAGLTAVEAQVVRLLVRRNGEIVSRDELSNAIDARPWQYGDRKFDVHVVKIRKKLRDAFGPNVTVKTIRSAGYQMQLNDVGAALPR